MAFKTLCAVLPTYEKDNKGFCLTEHMGDKGGQEGSFRTNASSSDGALYKQKTLSSGLWQKLAHLTRNPKL